MERRAVDPQQSFPDLEQSVRGSLSAIRESPHLPDSLELSGWVYDAQLLPLMRWARVPGLGEFLYALFYRAALDERMYLNFYDARLVTQAMVTFIPVGAAPPLTEEIIAHIGDLASAAPRPYTRPPSTRALARVKSFSRLPAPPLPRPRERCAVPRAHALWSCADREMVQGW